jgi:hypothetical protein
MSLIIKHNTVDISDSVLFKTLNVTDRRNDRVDVCSFQVQKDVGDTFTPLLNADIVVELDAVKKFSGKIQSIDETLISENSILFNVKCVDHTHELDRLLVVERYENTTLNAVIADLMSVYASDFTIVNVQADVTVDSVAFNRLKVSQCLKKLADGFNFNWYVDYDKDLHFFAKEGELAPFNITDTSDNFIFESLKIQRDLSQLRNKVLVEGGEVVGATRTVKYAGNTDQQEFDTQYKFASLPDVEVDGVVQTVGIDNLNDDADFDCMWNFQQKYVRFTAGNLPPAPSTGFTNVDLIGDPLYPIVVNVPSPASIAEFGFREFAIKDTTIRTQQQAIERAIAEIQSYGAEINEGSFKTYTAGLRSGQLININSSLRGVSEDYVIQSVKMRQLSPTSEYPAVWTVSLATLRTIGIINILQKLLLDEELEINEQETLLTFLQFLGTDNSLGVTDSISAPTTTTGPYVYGGATAVYDYSTWG